MRRWAGVLAALLVALASVPASSAADVSGMRGKQTVRAIASLGPRPAGSANERRAGAIVRERLETLGYTVSTQIVGLPNGRRSRNIVGRTPGPVRVVLVGHLDGVYGTQAANDNASGVAMVLEVARVLGVRSGLLVAALGAEERHVTGSRYHLGSLRLLRSLTRSERAGIRLALSLDMVGVGPTLNVRGLEATPNRSARIALRAGRALGYHVTYLRDTGQSDHAEMSRAGLPAAWIEWRWDRCWHSPCDTVARVNRGKLYRAGKVALRSARLTLRG